MNVYTISNSKIGETALTINIWLYSNINIFLLIFDEVIHLFYLGDMNSLASHEYILQIARIDKSAFKSNAIVLNGS